MENQKIAIDLMTEDDLKGATLAELELLQTELGAVANTLRSKQAMVAKVTEAKQLAANAVRKAGSLTEEEKTALQAHFAAEAAIKASDLSDDEKALALDALNKPEVKPPAQNLSGEHITKDADQINAGS